MYTCTFCSFLGCRVDGYAVINGVETVWEYNGCSFHGCPCVKNPVPNHQENLQKWIERKAKLEVNGCKVIEMKCCDWRKMKRYIRRNPPKTELGRILCFDNQECFIVWTNVQLFILNIVHSGQRNICSFWTICTTVHLFICKTLQEYCFESNQEWRSLWFHPL